MQQPPYPPPPPGGFGGPPRGPQQPPYGPQGYGPPQGFGPPQGYGPPQGFGPQGYGYAGAACPRCNGNFLTKPSFTWWGGLFGPKILDHTVCGSCGFGFNGKTGKSNNGAIAIYMVVVLVIVIGLLSLRALA